MKFVRKLVDISYFPRVCADGSEIVTAKIYYCFVYRSLCQAFGGNWVPDARNAETFKAQSQDCEKRVLASSYLPLRPSEWKTGRVFMKFDIGVFFENLSRKFELD
jgi:hypothetical protein